MDLVRRLRLPAMLAALAATAGCVDAPSGPTPDDATATAAGALAARSCTPPTSLLVINELMIDDDGRRCWIEVHNPGGDPVDLAGWRVADVDTMHPPFAGPAPIAPGGFATICRDGDPAANGGVACDLVLPGLDLNRLGTVRRVQLIWDVAVIDVVTYGALHPDGRAIQLRHPFLDNALLQAPDDPDDPDAWSGLPWGIQAAPGGSPNAPNDAVWAEQDAAECDDGLPCTWDLCIAGRCDNAHPRPDCCDDDAQCAASDDDPCTRPACIDNRCAEPPIPGCCTANADCTDDDPCTTDYCLAMRCRHAATADPGCCWAAPTDPVTGAPRSDAERLALASARCDDGDPCTPDACDLEAARCVAGPPIPGCCAGNLACDDGDPCTYDTCWSFTCRNPPKSGNCCTTDAACDDHDPCTRDFCALGTCRHLPDTGACCLDDAWCRAHFDDDDPCTDETCRADPITGSRRCVRTPAVPCRRAIPYAEDFDGGRDLDALGWRPRVAGAIGPLAWRIGETDLPAPAPHLTAAPGALGPGGRAVVMTPLLDTTPAAWDVANPDRITTAQWQLSWTQGPAPSPAMLTVGATDVSDPDGPVLWQAAVGRDLPAALYSVPLPAPLDVSHGVSLLFRVDAPEGGGMVAGTLRVDDVRVAAGVPNRPYRIRTFRCPEAGPCTPASATPDADLPMDAPASLALAACDRALVLVCAEDTDAYYGTWNYFGYPGAAVAGAPFAAADFVRPIEGVTESGGCGTLDLAVRGLCGPGPRGSPGAFYCGFEIAPGCDASTIGTHRVGLRVLDEWTPGKRAHSPFESLTPVELVVTAP